MIDSTAQKDQITTNLGRPLDPWIPVKQCSRSDGSAIQPILPSPGQSGTQAKPLAFPRASDMRSKASPTTQNGPQKACPRTSTGIQRVTAIKQATKPTSNQPQERGRRQGAKPFIFAAPPKGEQGVLNLLSESQNLKLRGAPPPAAGPCPKCSKIDEFSDLSKYHEQN